MADTAKPDTPFIAALTCIFSQDSDSCDDNTLGQELSVEIVDAGAGPYLVLETKRWTLNGVQDLSALLKRVQAAWSMLGAREKLS